MNIYEWLRKLRTSLPDGGLIVPDRGEVNLGESDWLIFYL